MGYYSKRKTKKRMKTRGICGVGSAQTETTLRMLQGMKGKFHSSHQLKRRRP